MSQLFQAMQTGTGMTENGAVTHTSSLDPVLDLFFVIGASRGRDITPEFARAYGANPSLAVKVLLWAGDVREGAGERNTFKTLVRYLTSTGHISDPNLLFKTVVELTRWDNLFTFVGTALEKEMFDFYANAVFVEKDQLAAKWCPREKSSKRDFAFKFKNHLGISSKQYRKTLASISNTVEQKMCSGDWSSIEFGKVPSVAAARYQKAFGRNAPEEYEAYKAKLETGEEKINAGAVYPYDVVKSLSYGDKRTAVKQWEALPNYLEGCGDRILPVVDTSYSMNVKVSGITTAMDVAISLGLYLSERLEGLFNNKFITFSTNPQLQEVRGDLSNRYTSMRSCDWGGSTDLQATFDLILNAAVKHNLLESEMPTKILIVSDMEFDSATGFGRSTNFETIKQKYERAGYEMPQLVFWNVNARNTDNLPVQKRDDGTALVSGFSPSIMKSLLKGELDPVNVMLDTVDKPRYNTDFLVA